MLTLLYGTRRAREEIYRRIRRDTNGARRAYLIVPDQKALLAEGELAAVLPPRAALYVDAVGFSRLSNLVCRRYGGLTYNYANDGAKALSMYRAVEKLRPMLKVFTGEVKPATLTALCALCTEFRAAAVTPDALAAAADKLPPSPLADKLRDLSLLFTAYEALLHEHFAEQTDDIDTLCDLLAAHDFFAGAAVYIDSFVSFTKQEMTVLERMLSRGVEVTVALPYARGGGVHLLECDDTRKRLVKLAARLGCQFDEQYTADAEPDAENPLDFAKAHIWNFAAGETFAGEVGDALVVARCTARREEARLCACEIYRAVADGAAYSDIAVVMRNAEDYAGILDRYLARCGIPFFFSKKTDAATLPLTRLILSALSLLVWNFRTADVAAYIKTGLCGLSDEECDLFEEYITRWNISGRERYLDGEDFTMSRDGYTAEVPDAASLADVNAVKHKFAAPLARLADSLTHAGTVRDFAAAVYDYLADCDMQNACMRPEVVRYFGVDRTADAIRLWNVTMDALDTLVDAAGDETVTTAQFCTLVELLFSGIDIAEIPSSMDQVMLGSADSIRIDRRKYVIVLGVNEGIFPAPVAESPTLCESERRALAAVGVELSQSLELRSARELYSFVRVLDFAETRVTVAYHVTAADGSQASPSFAVERLQRIFGDSLHTYDFAALAPIERLCYTAAAADAAAAAGGAYGDALRGVLQKQGVSVPPVNAGHITGGDAALMPETTAALFGEVLRLSQSRLDTYGDCRLKYFLQYMLSLKNDEPFSFNPADTGTYVHSILERFVRDTQAAGRRIADYTPEEIHDISVCLSTEESERIMRASGGGSARFVSFFCRMQKNVELILTDLVAEFAESDYEPLLCEYKIGMGGGHAPLVLNLPAGGHAMLRGIADRIDICRAGGKTYLRVVDYKTGKKVFRESDLEKGKNLQLLIYLFTLCRVADADFLALTGAESTDALVPAGATYYVVKPPTVKRDAPPAAEADIFAEAAGMLDRSGFTLDSETLGGMLDRTEKKIFSSKLTRKDEDGMAALFETVQNAVSTLAGDMRAGKIDCADTARGENGPCRYCDYAAVCRMSRAKGEDDDA